MTQTTIDETAFTAAITAGVQAPSLHNSQLWRFRLREGEIEVLADRARQLTASDPTGWALRIACGAASFNMRLASAALGRPVEVRWRPSTSDPDVMASLRPATPRAALNPSMRRSARCW